MTRRHLGLTLDYCVRRFRSSPLISNYVEVRHDGVDRILFLLRNKPPGKVIVKTFEGSLSLWAITTRDFNHLARLINAQMFKEVWNS